MNTQKFLRRLDRYLRWFLPTAEAREVLEDYQEMHRQAAEAGETFPPAGEKPLQIARALQNPGEYRRWLLLLAGLLLWPLSLLLFYLTRDFSSLMLRYLPGRNLYWFFWLSLGLCLYWRYRQKSRQTAPAPRRLLLGSFLYLALCLPLASLPVYWYIEVNYGRCMWITGSFIGNYLWLFCALALLACGLGLLQCRLQSYHWLGLYLLGCTMLFGGMLYMAMLRNMHLDSDLMREGADQLKFYLPHLLCGLAASLRLLL